MLPLFCCSFFCQLFICCLRLLVAWSLGLVTTTSSDPIEETSPSTLKEDEETNEPEAAVEAYRDIVTSIYCLPEEEREAVQLWIPEMATAGVSGGQAAAGTADVEMNGDQEMSEVESAKQDNEGGQGAD